MGGIVGRLFREFAVTLSVAIAVSARRLAHAHADDVLAAPQARAADEQRAPLPRLGARLRRRCVGVYERGLGVGAPPPDAHARSSRSARSRLTICLYIVVPKGLFPQQDAGHAHGLLRGAAGRLVPGDARRARSELNAHRHAPTPTSRTSSRSSAPAAGRPATPARMFVELKPIGERKSTRRRRSSRGCARKLAQVAGITLYLQAAQDVRVGGRAGAHAVPVHARRTPNLDELRDVGAAACSSSSKTLPELKDVASDQQTAGLQLDLEHRSRHRRRASASRRSRSTTRSTTPSASARSRRRTRELNQYRVVLEVEARAPARARRARPDLRALADGRRRCRSRALRASRRSTTTPLVDQPPGPVPGGRRSRSTSRPASRSGDAVDGDPRRPSRRSACPAACTPSFQGTAQAFQASLASRAAADPRRARSPSTSCSACSTRA